LDWLLVSAQNMGIPAHSSSVPVSTVGAGVAQQSLILPSVQHDSEPEVGEKRLAPDSAQELPGPSVGMLPLHMIQEETVCEDRDHAEETPSSPPCSGQQLSAEQYGMNTPAKTARGAGRRGLAVKSFPRVSRPLSSASKIQSCLGRFWTKTLWRGVCYLSTHMCVSNVGSSCA